MKTEWTFKRLVDEYQGKDEGFVEITDRQQALNDIKSTASCTWGAGAKFGESGWIKLASPSKRHKEDTRTVFVCKASLIA